MCSQGKFRGDSKRQQERQDHSESTQKTWSRKLAEHLAHKYTPSVPQVLEVTSEDSSAEDVDSLPDLDDDLPDLKPILQEPSSPEIPVTMVGLRRRHSKERHFLDTFEPSPKHRRMTDESKSKSSVVYEPGDTVHRVPIVAEESDWHSETVCEPDDTPTKVAAQARQRQRRRDRISQEMQAGSTPVHQEEYRVFSFPADIVSKTLIDRRASVASELVSRRIKTKFSGVRFLQDLTAYPSGLDRLCSDFVKLQTVCLDDLSDDLSDPCNFSNCMDLLEDFCNKRKPPPVIMDKIINNEFFNAVDEKMSVRTYHVVLRVWQQFPDLIRIDVPSVLVAGDVLQKYLQNNGPAASRTTSSFSRPGDVRKGRPSFRQARLYFQLFVKGLQLNLSQCTLADQKSVNKSLAFACLSSESSKTLIKQVTHWLEFCLVVRHPEHVQVAKLWMCELQTLLGASVLVSRDRQEAAKILAPGLKRTYKYLTDLNAKKLLLQSFSCPLLCFYVLRLVMEDQCESTIPSSQFPSTIEEVIHNYFLALPPQDHLTPPPSPSEEEQDNRHGQFRMYSVQSCEELAMLVFFISKSFIACKQRRLSSDLRQQILKGPDVPTLKRDIQHSVQEFGAHLRNHCPELSAATITYLSLLECLSLST